MTWQKFTLNRPGNSLVQFTGREFCVTTLPQVDKRDSFYSERVAFYIRRDGKVVLECATLDDSQNTFTSVTVHETLGCRRFPGDATPQYGFVRTIV